MQYKKAIKNSFPFLMAVLGLWLMMSSFHVRAQSRSFLFDIRSAAYKGLLMYEEGNYTAAVPLLEQAVKQPKNRQNKLLILSLAHAYMASGSAKSAAEWYTLLQDSGFELEGQHLLFYANALMASGALEEGRQGLMNFLILSGKEEQANALKEQVLADLYRDSIRYTVSPVSINSAAAEFSPVLVEKGLLFVSERPKARLVKKHFSADESSGLDVFYGRINQEGDVRQMIRLNEIVNSQMPEGPVSVTKDGKELFYTRAGNQGKMELYQAKSIFNVTTWFNEKPLKLPVKASVGHPAVAENGQVLYFISDMPGGYGGTDIYRIDRSNSGWSQPINLGSKVNTAGNEMFPSLNGKNKLYFASNGHFGLGGLDLYEASLIDDSIFNVRNMGIPVNSAGDDFSLTMDGSGDWGYFSSNRAGGAGKDDIYRLDVHMISLIGRVYDKVNGKSVGNTKVRLFQNEVLLQETISDKKGGFSFSLYPGQEYELRYSVEEFREFKEVVSTRQGPRYGPVKWETGLERKVKMFVLGTIKNSTKGRAADASMWVIDQSSGRIDTVLADQKGNYEMELDARSTYTFVTNCNDEGTVTYFSTPERGKASLSYFVDIELRPSGTYQLKGWVSPEKGEKGPFVISRLNRLTLAQDFIYTDEEGFFTFQANALVEYELCLMHEKNSAPILLMPGWKQKEREVFFSW